ncbi:MAG: dienelactone hydrolase family protein [Betaproteobacteria bacterium]|nr:dienelactone hydrolase family protein [Betaproteobacteria bacterium]
MKKHAAPLILLLSLCGCAATGDQPSPSGSASPLQVPFKVVSPDGPGPFPAIVMMHDCSGLGPNSSGAPNRWAKELVSQGYVVIMPDSFSTRGFPDGVCTNDSPQRIEVAPARRQTDAYAALAHLRTLPNVDSARVGLMGGSHGGATTLATMALTGNQPRSGFSAAIALYPNCGIRLGDWRADGSGVYRPQAPLLILTGELDDWTPAAPCQRMTDVSRQAGHPVSIKVYPGAHHSFDSNRPVRYVATRMNANAPGGRGATTGGNAEAWADSINEVKNFFGKYLKKN